MGKGVWIGLGTMAAIAVVAVILVATRPGDDSGSTANGSVASSSSSALTTRPATTIGPTETAVLDAYRAAWRAFVTVASDPAAKADDPRLLQNNAGSALLARQAYLVRLKSDGRAWRGDVELHPSVVEVTGTTAKVQDCNVDRTSVIDVRTGQVVVPPATSGAAVTAMLRLEGGVWKQVEFTDEKRTCVPPPS